jgi:hypothetical protein
MEASVLAQFLKLSAEPGRKGYGKVGLTWNKRNDYAKLTIKFATFAKCVQTARIISINK